MDYQIIIHTGGQGTRMLPLTLDKPKVLLEVRGKPMLEYFVQMFIDAGLTNFVITTSYKADMIKDFFRSKGLNAKFIDEPTPAGRGGAIQLGIKQGLLDPEKPAIQIQADDLLKVDLKEFIKAHEESNCHITIGLSKDFQNPYGLANIESNKITNFVEKPMQKLGEGRGINAGLVAFKNLKPFLAYEPPFHAEHTVYPELAKQGQVAAFFVDFWFPVNTKEQLKKAQEFKF